jgi:pimeloyl-ACP methyl ester carboxylesterase
VTSTSSTFHHDGVDLAVTRDGTPGGSPVLLLHGLSGISSSYDAVVRSLDQTLDIYRIDLRGHGRSGRAPGTYQVPFYAADVVAFIEQVIARPIVMAGHSLGGVITHHIAATRPDLITAALCEDPPLYFCDQTLFAASMFGTIFPILEKEMIGLQERRATKDEVMAFVANSPSPVGGIAGDHQTAESTASRADALMLGDPGVWGPAIHGGALSGYDPNAAVACALTILLADPNMGPAFWTDHIDWQRAANPHADIVIIKGAPHGISGHIPSSNRYVGFLKDLIATSS